MKRCPILVLIFLLAWSPVLGKVEINRVDRDIIYDDSLHGSTFPLPVIIGFGGNVQLGIGVGSTPISGSIVPSLIVGGDYGKKTYRLPLHNRQLFNLPNNRMPYKAVQRARIDAGGGASISALMPGYWSLYATVIPKIGASWEAEKFLSHYEDRHDIKLEIPYKRQDLARWNIGDVLTFSTKRGAYASLGIGLSILLQGGGAYIYDGETIVRIEKVSSHGMRVNFIKSHSHSLGGIITTPIAYIKDNALRQRDRNYAFAFDFRRAHAERHYQDLLWGRLDATVDAAKQADSGVSDLSLSYSRARGRVFTASAGLPIIHVSELNKKHLGIAQLKAPRGDDPASPIFMALATKTTSTSGLASKHLSKQRAFYSMAKPAHGEQSQQYGGSFKWFYERGDSKPEKLAKQLAKIRRRLGIKHLADTFTSSAARGYLRLELTMNLAQRDIDAWMERISWQSSAQHKANITDAVQRYFADHPDAKKLCRVEAFCYESLKRASRRTVEALHAKLDEMKEAKERGDLATLTGALAQFGYLLAKNRFVLGYFVKMLDHAAPTLSLTILGEQTEPFYQKISLLSPDRQAFPL